MDKILDTLLPSNKLSTQEDEVEAEETSGLMPAADTSTPDNSVKDQCTKVRGGHSKVCRVCGKSEYSASGTLMSPCKCTRTRYKYAHSTCLVSWINSKQIAECKHCHVIYNCSFYTTPLRSWELDPLTKQEIGTYITGVIVGMMILALDSFVIYLVSFLLIPLRVQVVVVTVLVALLLSCLLFGVVRGYKVYLNVLMYNCDVKSVEKFGDPVMSDFKGICLWILGKIL